MDTTNLGIKYLDSYFHLINISPPNIFQKMLFLEKYYQNCQACFGLSKCEWVKKPSDIRQHLTADSNQTQPDNFGEILQAKAKLGNNL